MLRSSLLFAGALVIGVGCFQTATLIEDGSGGTGATGGAPTGGNTGAGATGGDPTTGGAGGTVLPCTADECPGTDNDCRTRVCDPSCQYAFQGEGTLCDDDGGVACDGAGNCVECTEAMHCNGVGEVCVNNACVAGTLANGDSCSDNAQCMSNICQQDDGVCCDAACTGTCESCLGASTCAVSDGTCAPITAGTDPDSECGADTCMGGACQNGSVVFVTSAAYNGNLGGLTGADMLCANHATAACLPGTYLAWLSDTTGSPSTRFTQQTVPYRMVDGTQVAVNWASLIDNNIDTPINLNEDGAAPAASTDFCMKTSLVYTGTEFDGTLRGDKHCGDWSNTTDEAAFGATDEMNNWWSFLCEGTSGGTCAVSAPLYCFQQ